MCGGSAFAIFIVTELFLPYWLLLQAKIRETMEAAFWDGIMESIKQDEPCYDRVVELVREVRNGISGMAPQSWKHEIDEVIDLDILSQVEGLLLFSFVGRSYVIYLIP